MDHWSDSDDVVGLCDEIGLQILCQSCVSFVELHYSAARSAQTADLLWLNQHFRATEAFRAHSTYVFRLQVRRSSAGATLPRKGSISRPQYWYFCLGARRPSAGATVPRNGRISRPQYWYLRLGARRSWAGSTLPRKGSISRQQYWCLRLGAHRSSAGSTLLSNGSDDVSVWELIGLGLAKNLPFSLMHSVQAPPLIARMKGSADWDEGGDNPSLFSRRRWAQTCLVFSTPTGNQALREVADDDDDDVVDDVEAERTRVRMVIKVLRLWRRWRRRL